MSDIVLDIHPDAQAHFDAKGYSLVQLCSEGESGRVRRSSKPRFPSIYTTTTITDEDIAGEIQLGMRDGVGKQVARYFTHQGKQVGLQNAGYVQFIRVCETIQRAIKPSATVSQSAVEDKVFDWIRDRVRGDTADELTGYILPRLEEKITKQEVWVPIAQLRVQSAFPLGKIEIHPISEELIDHWRFTALAKAQPEAGRQISEFLEKKLRKRLQGWSAGVIRLEAEPIAAKEIALQETERSLTVLRMFSFAALTPASTCYSAVMGRENIESVTMLIFSEGAFSNYSQWGIDDGCRPWYLANDDVRLAHKTGLDILGKLLREDSLTSFETSILDSLTLYSQATREKELASKLVYILASLEGILLKNDTEPIQQNLGERIATLIGKDLEHKKSIIKNVKAVYRLRSAFLHHAHTVDDYSTLEKFVHNAWYTMMNAVKNHHRFPTKQDFASAIDDRKLAPQG